MSRFEAICWGVVLVMVYGYAAYLKLTEPKP